MRKDVDYRMPAAAARGVSGGLEREGPAMAGPFRAPRGDAGGQMRSQSCDLQMKATQPETLSFAPFSTSSIFDL